MKKNYLIISTLLLFLISLSACRAPRRDDLFKQKPEGDSLVQSDEGEAAENEVDYNQQEVSDASLHTDGPLTNADQTQEEMQTMSTDQTQDEKQTISTDQISDEMHTKNTDQKQDEKQTMSTDQTSDEMQTMHTNQIDGQETLGGNRMNSFYYEELSEEIKERINGKSYGKNCDIPYEELRYVKVLHYGFDGEVHEGEMIVNKAIAQDTVDIFKELHDEKYPIERMILVDDYDADDNTSMAANNSSAFNYRVIEGTNRISLHSYGMAIDINPLYNPYVHTVDGETVVTPVNGAEYEDRSLDCEYYIDTEDACYKAFTKRGFTWGGDWKSLKDYQHFQKSLE